MKTEHNQYMPLGRNNFDPYLQRFISLIPNSDSFLLALLAGALLFHESIIIGLISTIVNLGVDEQRARLIASFIMTMGTALVGAAGGRRKLGAILGAVCVFCLDYLAGFIQREFQPAYDPLGKMELLNGGALVHTTIVIVALALLSAFIGSAVGVALGEVLLDPIHNFTRFIRQRYTPNAHYANTQLQDNLRGKEARTVRDLLLPCLGTLALITLMLLASSASDLFAYAPDVGLHQPPVLHNNMHARNGLNMQKPTHGTIVHDEVVSAALGGQVKEFLVYLPPSYYTVQGKTTRFPTLYLLHGTPGRDSDWFTGGKADQAADTLIALGKIPELIMILPDGNGRPEETSEWGNSFDQQQKIETYVSTDLVRYVDAKYRTLADAAHRGIAGLSMGGFGAMNIAVHHPDIFGYVSSLGGYYRAEGSIWGNNDEYIRMNSPIEVLPADQQAWNLHMFIGAETQDGVYYTDAKEYVQELSQLQISYQFDTENGEHSWNTWQIEMYHTLLWLRWGN
jgi:enterochelin esterase-like enzyme